MHKKIFRISGWAVVLLVVFLLLMMFVPKKYNVPVYQVRTGTQYWSLSTGSRIGYTLVRAKGAKKPYPVIFLQGGPGGPVFDRNIELLSPLAEDGYDVYLYDQVGCGSSGRLDHIEEYTVERHKRDLEEIVRKIGAEKVILIGQSWGAMLATEYIADHAARVRKVIFTGPGPVLPWNHDLESIKPPDSLNLTQPVFTNRQGRNKIYNFRAKLVEACARSFNLKLASDKEMDAFSTLLNHEMGKSTVCNPDNPAVMRKMESGSGYYSMVMTVQSFNSVIDVRPQLAGCSVPALILRGQCDGIQWGYVTEYLRLFRDHILIIVPGAGHSIGIEQPEFYVEKIRGFLKE